MEYDLNEYKLGYIQSSEEIVVDIRNKLIETAKKVSEKLANFKTLYYGSVIIKMMEDTQAHISDIPSIHLEMSNQIVVSKDGEYNLVNELVILSHDDYVYLIYGLNFEQETDRSLIKVILQELKDSQNDELVFSVNIYDNEGDGLDSFIENEIDLSNFTNGVVCFKIDPDKVDKIKDKINMLIFFKEYIQFHVHSIKTNLHIKMKKKEVEIIDNLNACKVMPDEYFENVKDINFYPYEDDKTKLIFKDQADKVQV